MTNAYDYHGLITQAWDLFLGDTSQWADRFFYLEAIRRYGGPVLDVGCGTGRLLLDFLSRGIDAEGMDNSPEMLALLREKAGRLGLRPAVYLHGMEALDLPRRYQTILVPSGSFQRLIDPALARQAMDRFYRHLLPGGVLIMPFEKARKEGEPLVIDLPVREVVRPEDGAVFRRSVRNVYDPAIECESGELAYEMIVDGRVVAREEHIWSPATRSYVQAQSRRLYEEAGLSDIQLYAGYTWEPAKDDDTLWNIVGRR